MKKDIEFYAKDILESINFIQSVTCVQHGSYSVFQHSINVAKFSLKIANMLPLRVHKKELVRGALLHDYFLYDWHDKHVGIREILRFYKLHGFTHPSTAANNARRDFHLTKRENDIIRKHMWPLTMIPPSCREAWIVTFADKCCSLYETIWRNKGDLYGKAS